MTPATDPAGRKPIYTQTLSLSHSQGLPLTSVVTPSAGAHLQGMSVDLVVNYPW